MILRITASSSKDTQKKTSDFITCKFIKVTGNLWTFANQIIDRAGK